jgi:hypothetical protein
MGTPCLEVGSSRWISYYNYSAGLVDVDVDDVPTETRSRKVSRGSSLVDSRCSQYVPYVTHLLIRAYSYLMVLFDNFGFRKSSTVVVDPARTAEVHFSDFRGLFKTARASNGNSIERWRQTDCKEMSESNQ